MSREEFEKAFCARYLCTHNIAITDGFDITSSKTVGKLEVDEIAEALSEAKKNETLGIMRIRIRVEGNSKEGWVSMKGNQGTTYIEVFSPFMSFSKKLDRQMTLASKSFQKTSNYIKQKVQELSSCSRGPLVDARKELEKLEPRMQKASKALTELKRKVMDAKRDYSKAEEDAKKAIKEAKERKLAQEALKSAEEKVEALEGELAKLIEATSPLTSLSAADLLAFPDPIAVNEAAEERRAQLESACAVAREIISKEQSAAGKAEGTIINELKKGLSKLGNRVVDAEKKCKADIISVKAACTSIAQPAVAKVAAALRAETQKRGISVDALYLEMVGEGDFITEESFCKKVEALPDLGISALHAKNLSRHIEASGIRRRSFLRIVQQYYVCVKEIAITTEFEISKGKAIRKIEPGESIEVLEGPQSDEKLAMMRVKGRIIADGSVGWISVKGNQGTPFLKETEKPWYACIREEALEKEFATASAERIRPLKFDELLEVLEGPRDEVLAAAKLAKVKAASDSALGWFTVQDKHGEILAEPTKVYIVTKLIAMTDDVEIKSCKVVRKAEVGEVIEILEEPVTQSTGIMRLKGKAVKDGKQGWITIKGNAGTVYAEESSSYYEIKKSVSLQKKFGSESIEVVRTLQVGEKVNILEGPKEEKVTPTRRMKVRASIDGAVGWVTMTAKDPSLKAWTPRYICTRDTGLNSTKEVKGGEQVRRLEKGEFVELLEGPIEDGDLGVLRIRARAEKDHAEGWATLRGNQGTPFLEFIPRDLEVRSASGAAASSNTKK